MKQIKGVNIQYKDKDGNINNAKLTNHEALQYDRVSIHDAAQCYCNVNGFTLIASGSCIINIKSKKECLVKKHNVNLVVGNRPIELICHKHEITLNCLTSILRYTARQYNGNSMHNLITVSKQALLFTDNIQLYTIEITFSDSKTFTSNGLYGYILDLTADDLRVMGIEV